MEENKEDIGYIIDINGDNGIAEQERLRRQGLLITKALPLLPGDFSLQHGRIVDLACGVGEWCLKVATKLGENVEVIGVDINVSALSYANSLVAMKRKTNVEFRKMNVLQPLGFDDESCDLVNARLIVGILPIERWPAFLTECFRILKPGGILRLVESGPTTIDGCPTQHAMSALVMRALYKAGKTFSAYEYGVAPALHRMLRNSDFAQVELSSYLLDYSKWAPLHEPLVDDFILSVRMMRPFLLQFGEVTEQEFDRLLAGCIEENDNPAYSALWNIISIQARKPE